MQDKAVQHRITKAKIIQDKTMQHKATQYNIRQYETIYDKKRHDKSIRDNTMYDNIRQYGKTRHTNQYMIIEDKTRQYKTRNKQYNTNQDKPTHDSTTFEKTI